MLITNIIAKIKAVLPDATDGIATKIADTVTKDAGVTCIEVTICGKRRFQWPCNKSLNTAAS